MLLIELVSLQDPLAEIGVGPVNRNGASRRGALPESAQALTDSLPQISMLRAYTPELTGWFDDFGHSWFPDAFGGIGRISTTLNTFSAGTPGVPCPDALGILPAVPPGVQPCELVNPVDLLTALGEEGLKNLERCPGSNERGLSEEQLTHGGTIDCDPSQTPVGP